MKYNFDNIKLVNQNEILVKKLKKVKNLKIELKN